MKWTPCILPALLIGILSGCNLPTPQPQTAAPLLPTAAPSQTLTPPPATAAPTTAVFTSHTPPPTVTPLPATALPTETVFVSAVDNQELLREPIPGTTPPPTIAAPTQAVFESAYDFKELVVWMGGGAGGVCDPEDQPLPMIEAFPANEFLKMDQITACLMGLPAGDSVRLSIIDPWGRETPWITVIVPDEAEENPITGERYTLVQLPGFRSLAMSASGWQLRARFSTGELTTPLFPEPKSPAGPKSWWTGESPALTHSRLPTGAIVNPLDPALRAPYRPGETIYIQGIGFDPDRVVDLGLYHYSDPFSPDFYFTRSFAVRANGQGRFEVPLTIGPEFAEGRNAIIPASIFMAVPPDAPWDFSDANFASFEVHSNPPYPVVCGDTRTTSLEIGGRVMLTEGSSTLDLLNTAGEYRTTISTGSFQPGETARLLAEPQCGDSAVWWLLWNEYSGAVGWAPETNENGQLLSPVP